jgi:hemerythrin
LTGAGKLLKTSYLLRLIMQVSDSQYLIDFPEMDEQHRYLFFLFAKIENGTTVIDKVFMGKLLKEIEQYLLFHLTCEEQLMRLYGFQQFAVHQSDHEVFSKRFIHFLEQFDSDGMNPAALQIFLTGYFLEHITTSDISYVNWINEKRNEIGRAENCLNIAGV